MIRGQSGMRTGCPRYAPTLHVRTSIDTARRRMHRPRDCTVNRVPMVGLETRTVLTVNAPPKENVQHNNHGDVLPGTAEGGRPLQVTWERKREAPPRSDVLGG